MGTGRSGRCINTKGSDRNVRNFTLVNPIENIITEPRLQGEVLQIESGGYKPKVAISEGLSEFNSLYFEANNDNDLSLEEELKIYSCDIAEIINFIENECSDDTFCRISKIFENIVAKTKSIEFIAAIKKRAEKIVDTEQRRDVGINIRYAEYKLISR